jgi:hypothetical protein
MGICRRRWVYTYRGDGSIIEMQFKTISWEGSVKFLLKSVDRWVSPGRVAQENEFDHPSDEVLPEIRADGVWEILNTNHMFGPVLVHTGTW